MKAPSIPTALVRVRFNVLSVSPIEEDHSALGRIFHEVTRTAPVDTLWRLSRARTLASARAALRQLEYAVVLCERDLGPGRWTDVLEMTQRLAVPPFLIVTSRHADEYLWAEALNLGAHDVLAKPFYAIELVRVVNLACMRWHRERQRDWRSMIVGAAGSM